MNWEHDAVAPLLSVEEPEPYEPPVAFIGPTSDRRQAREWGLVLQSQNIGYTLLPISGGWALRVAIEAESSALRAVALYEEENENWPPPRRVDRPRHRASILIPLAFVSLALFHFYVTGSSQNGSRWFVHGAADAHRLFTEPWRMVTALTLHADGTHVLGNVISGSIFGAMVSRRIGPGGAMLAIVLAGTAGNTANALYHLVEGHRSIGASTAVFAAIGILTAVQTAIGFRRDEPASKDLMRLLTPLAGGLALLGSLGASPDSDLSAHAFGFAGGLLVGAPIALTLRFRPSKPSMTLQLASLVAAAGVIWGSWWLALGPAMFR